VVRYLYRSGGDIDNLMLPLQGPTGKFRHIRLAPQNTRRTELVLSNAKQLTVITPVPSKLALVGLPVPTGPLTEAEWVDLLRVTVGLGVEVGAAHR
jgi:hypothetical protein